MVSHQESGAILYQNIAAGVSVRKGMNVTETLQDIKSSSTVINRVEQENICPCRKFEKPSLAGRPDHLWEQDHFVLRLGREFGNAIALVNILVLMEGCHVWLRYGGGRQLLPMAMELCPAWRNF